MIFEDAIVVFGLACGVTGLTLVYTGLKKAGLTRGTRRHD
jgi:hypothetical protein